MSRSSSKKNRRYGEFKSNLRTVYTETVESLDPPDFGFLESIPQNASPTHVRKYKVPLRIAAAAVLAVILGFGSFFTANAIGNAIGRRTAIRGEASRFVEALFDQPLFDQGSEGIGETFGDFDILTDLVLPLPQSEDLLETL